MASCKIINYEFLSKVTGVIQLWRRINNVINAIDLPLLYTKGTTSVEWKYSAGGVKLQKRTTSQ